MPEHEFDNMTSLGVERGYPSRTALSDDLVSWGTSLPDSVSYGEPVVNLSPARGSVTEKLLRAGLDVAGEKEIIDLARMGHGDVATLYGPDFAEALARLRFPLGRTGLNGVGIFYEAGASQTADMITFLVDGDEVFTPLVNTRSRWNTPGGFSEAYDGGAEETAIRELFEETGFDLACTDSEIKSILNEVKTSDRTCDNAWLEANVFAAIVSERFDPTRGDDPDAEIKDAQWFNVKELPALTSQKLLSQAKLKYIEAARKVLELGD